jgi:uncharacterized coiled-coil protein SlyX
MLNSQEIAQGGPFPFSRRFSADHNGEDLATPTGTPIIARFSGVLTTNGTNPVDQDFGNYVRVNYDNYNLTGWYAHLDRFNLPVGAKVNKGDVIAFSGHSGYTTPQGVGGSHCHYGESVKNTLNWINPDNTKGGDDMVTNQILEALFTVYLERNPDPGAYTTYVGKPIWEVLVAIADSAERKALVARKNQELTELKVKTQNQTVQIAQLNDTLTGQGKIIDEQEQTIAELTDKVTKLEKAASTPSQGLPKPTLSSVLESIRQLIKGWLS